MSIASRLNSFAASAYQMGKSTSFGSRINNAVESRLKSFLSVGAEGSYRGPFYGTGGFGGSFMLDPLEDGWSRNLSRNLEGDRVSVVYACVMMSARAISQCEPKHLKIGSKDGYEQSTTSPASRILRIPNDHQTWPQLITNITAELLFKGESIIVAVRDDRYAIQKTFWVPRNSWSVYFEESEREYYYQINTNGELFSEPDMLVPARDVCHFRQYCPRHALVGESPLAAAGLAVGLQVALNQSQLAFFSNMDRPSGTLQTDLELKSEQVQELRQRFSEQSKKWNQGGTPILSHGIKFNPVGIAQVDAQLVEQQKLSALEIANVFGVPYALLGANAGPQGGTEALITYWLSVGLGSLIESLERSLDRFFQLDASERIELDPTPLLRVDQSSLIDALGNAIQKGVMTPDEARARVRLSKVAGGDQAYLQRQMTAMGVLGDINQAELAGKVNEAQSVSEGTEPNEPEDDTQETDEEEKRLALACEYTRLALEKRLTGFRQ